MFSFWLLRNKHFKQGDNLRGQIFPFLLICIAALIVAAGMSIRAGSSVTSRTCVSNAADAGSLAVGSGASGAFNTLVLTNKDLETYYTDNRNYYTILYNLSKGYLEAGIKASNNAETAVNEALDDIGTSDGSKENCPVLWHQGYGSVHNTTAAEYALEAAKNYGAFAILTQYMASFTANFKDNQLNGYCSNVRKFMDDSFVSAKATGLSYAFSNSCTSSRAPDGDAFNFWLGNNNYYVKDPNTGKPTNESTNKSTYKWPADSQKCGAGDCGITVNIDLPEIASYQVKHTLWNYPEKKTVYIVNDATCSTLSFETATISDDYFNWVSAVTLANIMNDITLNLTSSADFGMDIYRRSRKTSECCEALKDPALVASQTACCQTLFSEESDSCSDPYHYHMLYAWVNTLYKLGNSDGAVTCLGKWLRRLNTLGESFLTGNTLLAFNKNIYEKVWQDPSAATSIFVSKDKLCDDVWGYAHSTAKAADAWPIEKSLMIIKVADEPEFIGPPNPWQTKCTVTSFCNNIFSERNNNCYSFATTRASTVDFHGEGDLKQLLDKYEATIIAAN